MTAFEALEVVALDVPDVQRELWDRVRCWSERALPEQARVQPDDLVAVGVQDGNDHGTEVAEMAGQ